MWAYSLQIYPRAYKKAVPMHAQGAAFHLRCWRTETCSLDPYRLRPHRGEEGRVCMPLVSYLLNGVL